MVGTYNRKNFIFEQQTQTCTYKVNIIELTENKIYSIYIELKIFYNTYLFSWRSVESSRSRVDVGLHYLSIRNGST